MRWTALLLILLLASCARNGRPRLELEGGVVASPEPKASHVGAEILRKGGNAVDAAVAVQFALAVTFPVAGNIGGGGFMMIHEPDGTVHALDYRETAPGAAHPDLYLDDDGEVVAGLSLFSRLAAGVPGSVMGMWEAHRKFGSLEWKDVLAPAILLAEEGWDLEEREARSFASAAARYGLLSPRYRKANNFADYFAGKAGERFVQKELAATLRRIAENGPDGFYGGETARRIVEEMKRDGGIITLEDLAAYRAKWREPVVGTYRGHRVCSMPPPSSGGVALVQLLNMLETFDVPPRHSAKHLHLVAEIEKRVFADRSVYLGDADYFDVPVRRLIDKEYGRKRADSIDPRMKTDPGSIGEGRVRRESDQTTHFSIIDRRGMAVSNTTTLNAGYGSGIVVTGAGFLLNNEMDDFSSKPGVPNLYGVIGAEANKIESGKRMLSSMSPTFVFDRDGRLWLVLGTPGGPTIFTTVFQVIVNKVDYGMPLADAVNAPRFHHQWPPPAKDTDPIRVESRKGFELDPSVPEWLEKHGYTVRRTGSIGDVHAIEVLGTKAVGASDARGIGKVEHE